MPLTDPRWWLAMVLMAIAINGFAISDGWLRVISAIAISSICNALYLIRPNGKLPK